MSLLPEKPAFRERSPVRVYRSETFGLSLQERVHRDAQHLLDSGLASSVDDAVEMAIQAIQNPKRARNDINDIVGSAPRGRRAP